MPEISHLNGDSDWIEIDFVDREETLQELRKLGIHLHVEKYRFQILSVFSISSAYNVVRCRSQLGAESRPTAN